MVNLIEPGDNVIVCINGVFGQRMRDIAERCGAQVYTVEAPFGKPIDPEDVKQAAKEAGKIKLISVVHAETSTGVLQPLPEMSEIAKKYDALFVVDAVTSLGGIDPRIDEWGIDACYSGTQKAPSCPPGLSPSNIRQQSYGNNC